MTESGMVHSRTREADEPRPNAVLRFGQTFAGLFVPLAVLRPFRGILSNPVLLFFAALWAFVLLNTAATYATKGFPPFENPPKLEPTISCLGGMLWRAMIGVLQLSAFLCVAFDWMFFSAFARVPSHLTSFERGLKTRIRLERSIYSLIGTLFVIGFSLLPLSALLVALPAAAPDEAVLSDSVRPARTFWSKLRRRVFAAVAGTLVLVGLFGFAIEAVSRMPLPEGGQLAALAKKVLGTTVLDTMMPEEFTEQAPKDLPEGQQFLTARELLDKRRQYIEYTQRKNRNSDETRDAVVKLAEIDQQIEERLPTSPRLQVMLDPKLSPWLAKPLWTFLPPALVQHWPFVFLIVYGTDLALLLLIGRVPLAYNFRYLWVRRRDTALTALAFTVVVGLVVVLLAFVNGMYKLNESTGIPGNVLVLSDGATDELFSNLGYGDIGNVERIVVTEDERGRKLKTPAAVARGVIGPDGRFAPIPADTPKEKEPPGMVRLA